MEKELRKIYKITDKEHIFSVIIPKNKKDFAIVNVLIDGDFDFEGPVDELISYLNKSMDGYLSGYFDIDYDYDCDDGRKKYCLVVERYETTDEYAQRQEYHKEQREKNKIEKDKQNKIEEQKRIENEEKEKQEYARLKMKYGD